jgi:hypothetical protein
MMDEATRSAFVRSYVDVLSLVWSSKDFERRLATDPVGALRSCGLDLPSGSELVIVTDGVTQSGETVDRALLAWETGERTGRYELPIPTSASITATELSDSDLGDIVGGYSLAPPRHVAWPGMARSAG